MLFQLVVEAWDSASPDVRVDTQLTVLVTRNEFAPVLSSSSPTVEVSEHLAVGEAIIQLNASDDDVQVHSVTCSNFTNAMRLLT